MKNIIHNQHKCIMHCTNGFNINICCIHSSWILYFYRAKFLNVFIHQLKCCVNFLNFLYIFFLFS